MDRELIWSQRASADMKEIHDWIAQHSPPAAARIVNEIIERVELLKTVPRMGRVYPKAGKPETRVIVCGKYRVFYDVREDDSGVEILTVRHHARDEPEL